jgi:phosphoribosylglycinamide formyltransferase 1
LSFVRSFQKTAVFISGTGSCLQALLEMSEFQNISLIVTNKKNVRGVLKAKRYGLQIHVTDSKIDFIQLNHFLKSQKIEKIILAGFMKILPTQFLMNWQNKIYNIHPSLLPKYKGLNAFQKSFDAKDSMGVSVHHVTAQMDEGKVVLQKKSLDYSDRITLIESEYLLRRTEQHLLREFSTKGFSNV